MRRAVQQQQRKAAAEWGNAQTWQGAWQRVAGAWLVARTGDEAAVEAEGERERVEEERTEHE